MNIITVTFGFCNLYSYIEIKSLMLLNLPKTVYFYILILMQLYNIKHC